MTQGGDPLSAEWRTYARRDWSHVRTEARDLIAALFPDEVLS